ncbi:MAG TPA: DUF899 family protein [Stellaceae bacterium]|nr:DUF899 family protein [Stellaceae bacterium]
MAARKRSTAPARPKKAQRKAAARRTEAKSATAFTSSIRFPNESAAYRRARDKLLAAEHALRREVESVAALRRRLPPGGTIPEDYVFEEIARDLGAHTTEQVRLSELFALPQASLVLYSFMYGPDMAAPCPMCTSILDALDGEAPHIAERINFAVVAKSPIERICDLAQERGWRNLRLLSSAGTSYNRDYHGETASGAQMPCLNVFEKRSGHVHHFTASELLYAKPDRNMGHRHVDMVWPLWNVFDFTREGRGASWYPKLSYRG